MVKKLLIVLLTVSATGYQACCQTQILENSMHHLRNGETREWSEFPLETNGRELKVKFSGRANDSDYTLRLKQYDVKQHWRVLLNDRELGSLVADEKDMIVYFAVPSNLLRDGQNELHITSDEKVSDDIKVGSIALDPRGVKEVIGEATLEIQVLEGESDVPLPSRITIVNSDGILQTVASSAEALVLRPGFVYTANGKALLQLPAGNYKIYAGRGFEYGVDSAQVQLRIGDRLEKTLRIRREVDTRGWISSDTHIHTFTHSKHGDATMRERAITLAGEGIELPIMTDHNIYVDLSPEAEATGVSSYFTPVIGDELTTKFGHFNIFKTVAGTPVFDANVRDWNDVIRNINDSDNSKAIILNHARDIHIGFRPFGTARHLSHAGSSNDDWKFPANAMEVINSGSQQTNIMNLYHDWFGMLNRGYFLTPVGSSDSHDVSRYIVGQGRTYIQSNDDDPGNIDVDAAIKNFKDGKVMVSLGLLTKLRVNNEYGPGATVNASGKVTATVEVWGPTWTRADHITLYANGKAIREEKIRDTGKAGLKWKSTWEIPLPKHDIFLVAIAEGPGSGMPFWSIAKPYQPASPDWTPRLMGSSGVVWIDADKNGKRNAAFDYAKEIVESSPNSIDKIIKRLTAYDEAVAAQVAALLWKAGTNLKSAEVSTGLKRARPETKAGFNIIINEIGQLENTR